MSSDGTIKVWSSHNQWMPLMTATATPIDVEFIALASKSRIQFFYDVAEDRRPSIPMLHIPTGADSDFKNPLFNIVDYPVGLTDLCKFFLALS